METSSGRTDVSQWTLVATGVGTAAIAALGGFDSAHASTDRDEAGLAYRRVAAIHTLRRPAG